MHEPFVAMVVAVTVVLGCTVVLTPIARAVARRIGGGGYAMEKRLAVLEAVVADLRDDQALVSRIEDRLTRAERRISGQPGRPRRSDRPSRSNGDPKVGKLWTPPPFKA